MHSTLIHDQGRAWQVLEYLDDCDSWVLAAVNEDGVIQANQFGEPRRRVPETRLVSADSHPTLYRRIQALAPGSGRD